MNRSDERRVDRLERFEFGGPAQWAVVRGNSQKAPVFLLIQAGPGLPIIGDALEFERRLRLEEEFRVVYWDQRGTGKSFEAKDRGPIAIETSIGDIRAMIRELCARLDVSQVDVVGFSFGGSLALLACEDPSMPVRSLTCVGADVRLLDNERFAHAFALAEAQRRGHRKALRALRDIGEPPHDARRFMERVKWVANFGGIHRRQDYGAMVRGAVARFWRSPDYNLRDMLRAFRGMEATTRRLLPGLQGFDLLATPLRPPVPVAAFHGRHDKVAPPGLAVELGRRLGVDVVWFEDSAHLPHEEEPARFREELLRFVSTAGVRSLDTKPVRAAP